MQNKFNKIKKYLFDRNNLQTFMIRLSAVIPGILLLVSLIGIISGTVFRFVIPVALLASFVLSVYLMLLLVQFIKSIRLIDNNAIVLSQGDLNIDDIIAEKTRGFEILTSAINDMKRNLLSYIESTKSNVIILSDAVGKVTKSIDMTYKGNEQIAANITIVAERAQEQLKIARVTLEGIEKVSSGASLITTTLGNIESFVGNTVKLTSDGAEHLDKYNGQMELISENLVETVNFIQTLNSNLSEINVFGNLIMNITGQLHLLSLNSRVEAARAGEAGRGFSVVAQEMNKLSDATKDSVTQITNLLDNIIKSNAKVSESIAHVTNTFDMSKEIFQSVKVSFDTINSNANILNNDIKKVYEESRMISESTKEISIHGSVLHDASDDISRITQDVAAITEEELAENEEIKNQAISLKKMLSSIENLLKKYRTSILPVNEVSTKRLKFVMLSPANEPFWESVRQGALYAKTELKDKNAEVEFIGFDQIDHSFIDTLNEVIDTGCDGLILPGFVKGIGECVDRAAAKKIPIMTFNCDLADETKRLSYFGPNVSAEGTLAGEILARSIDEKGEIVVFSGNSKSLIHEKRREAAKTALYRYDDIKVVGTVDNIENNIDVYKKLKEMLNYLTNINGVLVIGQGAPGAARVIEEMKLVGKVKLLCFDYNDEIVELIKKGIVHKVFRQDPFSQGHDPIIYLYNYLVANVAPENTTYTRTEVIDKYSVSDF